MGTRSMVGMMVGDKCRAVYVHFDGYLEGVGAELQSYTEQAEVEALLEDGDRSSLDGGFYSEQGMQGDDYVSCDVGKKFLKSWAAKFGTDLAAMLREQEEAFKARWG